MSAVFVVVLGTAWLVGRNLIAPQHAVDRYRGLVRLAPDRDGRCELFELDNRTGLMWPKGSAPCGYDITAAVPARSQASGSLGRLHGISDHFKSR